MYATISDMVAAFGEQEIIELSNLDDSDAIATTDEIVEKAIADASNQIDAYLGTKYAVPLAQPIPALVVNYTCDVARYLLDQDRPREEVVRRRDQVFKFLENVANGKAIIPGIIFIDPSTVQPSTSYDLPVIVSSRPVWSNENLRDYGSDSWYYWRGGG